jgi:GAF domain-containing protein
MRGFKIAFSGWPLPGTVGMALSIIGSRIGELTNLVEATQSRGNGSFVASILVLDAGRLYHAAAPGLPLVYCEAINGAEIGPDRGSCGTAAFCGHPIYVPDIARDVRWDSVPEIRDMALEAGFRACWSVPILASDDVILGTFAIYHREPRAPSPEERALINAAANMAAGIMTNQTR